MKRYFQHILIAAALGAFAVVAYGQAEAMKQFIGFSDGRIPPAEQLGRRFRSE